MEKKCAVSGEIIIPEAQFPAGTADVIVSVEDISRADAPAMVVGEQRQRSMLVRPGSQIPFMVEIPEKLIDGRRIYSVRAHIDKSGSGDVKPGDFVSTQTYPVLTRGFGTSATVKVRRV